MPATPEDLDRRLEELGIETTTHEHPPLFTVEDSKALRGDLPGAHIKNLFLRDKKGSMWLVVCLEDRAIDIKALRQVIGARGSLSFGSAERLRDALGVEPGAVTPFALLNDTAGAVTLYLDRGLADHEIVNAHPLANNRTTAIRYQDLLGFVRSTGHEPALIDLDAEPPQLV